MPDHETVGSPRRRRPILAVVLSGLFPGLGQLYNRERLKALLFFAGGAITLKALLFFAGEAITAFGPLNSLDMDIELNGLAVGLRKVLLASLPFLAVATWSVIDAYLTARRSGGK